MTGLILLLSSFEHDVLDKLGVFWFCSLAEWFL